MRTILVRFLLTLISYDGIIITCENCIGVIATIYHRGFAPYYTRARRFETRRLVRCSGDRVVQSVEDACRQRVRRARCILLINEVVVLPITYTRQSQYKRGKSSRMMQRTL